jgi:hypothetical protein
MLVELCGLQSICFLSYFIQPCFSPWMGAILFTMSDGSCNVKEEKSFITGLVLFVYDFWMNSTQIYVAIEPLFLLAVVIFFFIYVLDMLEWYNYKTCLNVKLPLYLA